MEANHYIVVNAERNEEFCEWIYQRGGIGTRLDPSQTRTIAYVRVEDGVEEILTVTALNNWTLGSCEASLATNGSKQPKASRTYIWTIFDFAFEHAGKSRMHTYVSVDNHKSIAIQEMLGLKLVARLADHFGEDKDAYLFGITKREWKKGKWASYEAAN